MNIEPRVLLSCLSLLTSLLKQPIIRLDEKLKAWFKKLVRRSID